MDDIKWNIKVSSKGQITLPKQVRDSMMVREGDHLEATMKGDAVVLTRRNDLSDAELIRRYAAKRLAELGYGDPALRAGLDARTLRGNLPRLPIDLTKRVREEREEK